MRFLLLAALIPFVYSHVAVHPNEIVRRPMFEPAGLTQESRRISDLRVLKMAKDPNVLEAILSDMSLTIKEADLAIALTTNIRQQMASSKGLVEPGSASHQIIRLCLEKLSQMENSHQYLTSLKPIYHVLIMSGSVDAVKTFMDFGVEMVPVGISEIKRNFMPMLDLLLHHGLRLENQVNQAIRLFYNPELTVEGFELLLANRLPWKMADRDSNWLIEALRAGRLDIGYFLYQKGMRLPNSKGDSSSTFKSSPMDLAWYIASKEGSFRLFPKYKTMIQGILGRGSSLSEVPKDVLNEMMSMMISLEAHSIHKDLYEPNN